MNINANYLAVVFNSTIRMMTPILFVGLGSAKFQIAQRNYEVIMEN